MFELFLDVIPIFHAKLLDELPLAAALHHNNTMFIAHHITTFGILFKGRLPQDLKVRDRNEDLPSYFSVFLHSICYRVMK